MNNAIVVKGQSHNENVILAWDTILAKSSDEVKSLGLDVLLEFPIKSIGVFVEVGGVAEMEIELYGKIEDIRSKLPTSLVNEIYLTEHLEGSPATTIFRCPVSKMEIEAFPPYAQNQNVEDGDDQIVEDTK